MAMTKGTKTTGTTYYNMRNDNSKFPVSITVTPVILAGKVIGTIKVFRDITYEHEIDKAKTEFVSLVSHQLRTPLSTVNWYAEMLLEGDAGELNIKQKKYLDEVYRSNRRMVELVNALLDVLSWGLSS
jgi:signal transduction histidine kinase